MTAEFAAALPAVILVLALCLSALQLTTVQLRVWDAAAVAARVSARGEGGAAGLVSQLVPGGRLSLESRGELICATVVAAGGPGPFAAVRMTGRSCAPSSNG